MGPCPFPVCCPAPPRRPLPAPTAPFPVPPPPCLPARSRLFVLRASIFWLLANAKRCSRAAGLQQCSRDGCVCLGERGCAAFTTELSYPPGLCTCVRTWGTYYTFSSKCFRFCVSQPADAGPGPASSSSGSSGCCSGDRGGGGRGSAHPHRPSSPRGRVHALVRGCTPLQNQAPLRAGRYFLDEHPWLSGSGQCA
jgi:hypothetical protein